MKRLIKYPSYFIYKIFISPFIILYYKRIISNDNCVGDKDNKRLSKILLNAVNNVKLYKNIKITDDPYSLLQKFPLLERKDLQLNRSKFISNTLFYAEFNTSGSSGDPLYFFRSAKASAVDDAHQISSYVKMGYKPGDVIISFGGFEPHKKLIENNIYWKKRTLFRQLPLGSIIFSSNTLSEKTIIYYLNKINQLKPAIIKGYPSAIYLFCKYLSNSGLHLSFTLKGVQLTSENIFEYQIEFIESYLKCKVQKQFGHTECAMFAQSDFDSALYFFSPYYGYVEILDIDGNHVNKGECGEVVVTSFHNTKQFFIRYKTNDFAMYEGIIDGKQAIRSIVGREQDYIVDRNQNRIPVTSIISGNHLAINKYITLWQIVQEQYGKLKIISLKKEKYPEECNVELNQLFSRYCDLEFVTVDEIKKTSSGKYKFFISKI